MVHVLFHVDHLLTPFSDSETAASIQRSTRSKNTRARNRAKLSSGRPHGEPEMEDHSTYLRHNFSFDQLVDDSFKRTDQPASKSPTPIFVTDELESQPTRAQAAEFLNRKFQKIVQDSGTQTLLDIGHAISNDPAYATQLEEQDTQVSANIVSLDPTLHGLNLDPVPGAHGNKRRRWIPPRPPQPS